MLTHTRLKELLQYNRRTGEFTWLIDRGGITKRIKAGSKAGYIEKSGYVKIRVDNRLYKAHRLAFLYVHGVWPTKLIDHKDGNPSNNALSNLREATYSENLGNQHSVRGGLAYRGVSKEGAKYRARIQKDGRTRYLGSFVTAEEAEAAYIKEHVKLFDRFSPYWRE